MPSTLAAAAAPGLPSVYDLETPIANLARLATVLRLVATATLDFDRPVSGHMVELVVPACDYEALKFLVHRLETEAEGLDERFHSAAWGIASYNVSIMET